MLCYGEPFVRRGAAHAMLARFWNALRREPLVHFLALAALLFVIYDLLMPSRTGAARHRPGQHRGGRRPAGGPARSAADRTGAQVGHRTRDRRRGAVARGLQARPGPGRRRAAASGAEDAFVLGEEVPEPSAAELRAYLAANRERYRGPPTVTLDHVFFADPADVPDELLAQLQNGRSIDGLGDPLAMLGDTLPRYTVRDLMGLVGPEVARRVFEAPAGEWRGPVRSERGVHFMRVAVRHPPSMPSFEELESYLRQDWILDQQRRAAAVRLAELRREYRIVVERTP